MQTGLEDLSPSTGRGICGGRRVESNSQGSYARLFSRQVPSPIGLPFRSAGG
jgi:hypothetical protein